MQEVPLRGYQDEFVGNAVDALAGCLSPLPGFRAATHGTAPTGAGKTRMSGSVLVRRRDEGPGLFIAHRDSLVEQNAAALRDTFGAHVVVEKAEQTGLQDGGDFDICCASIQTLASRPEVLQAVRFGTVGYDETHTAFTPEAQAVLAELGRTSPGAGLFGVTATSFRTDGADFTTLFGSHFFHRDLLWALREHWLKRMVVTQVTDESVVDRYFRLYAPGGEIEAETGHWVPTIIPAASVPEGRQIADEIRQRGGQALMADSLDGGDGDSKGVQAAFKEGRLPCLVAYTQIMEGFDAPRASAVLFQRNTESPVLFLQGIGRVLRPWPELMRYHHGDDAWAHYNSTATLEERALYMAEQVAYVDEFVGAKTSTRVYTVGKAVGFRNDFDFEGGDALEVTERGRYVAETYGIAASAFNSASHIEEVVERRDEFERVAVAADVPDNAKLVWSETGSDFVFAAKHKITLTTQERGAPNTPVDLDVYALVRVYQAPTGRWEVSIERREGYWMWFQAKGRWKTRRHAKWSTENRPGFYYCNDDEADPEDRPRYMHDPGFETTKIGSAPTKAGAFHGAERFIENRFPDEYQLGRADAPWRPHNLSDGQERVLAGLRKKRIPVPDGLTKGAASHLITRSFAGLVEPWAPVSRVKTAAII